MNGDSKHIIGRRKSSISNTKSVLGGISLFVFLLFSPKIEAQQDFINGFYMFNPLAFNPAITGVNDELVVSGIAREQWTSINGAPNTQYVNAHLPIFSWFDRYDRPGNIDYPTGLSSGLLLLNDQLGATQYMRLSLPIATRIRLTRSGIRLSLGLRVDGSRFSSDIDGLRGGSDEPLYLNKPRYFMDFATGLYMYHTRWYFGVSMTNMRGIDMKEYGYKFVPHYFGSFGYAQPLNPELVLRLTTLGAIIVGAPLTATVTPSVIIKNNIETGITYRYDDMVGAFFSFEPVPTLRLGYWYEYPTGVKTGRIGATHEIVLQLTFDRYKNRIISPRYFW